MEPQNPWIETSQSETGWQALFACQICLESFAELQRLRWGFNAGALLTEALDRQKLFVESQYHGDPLAEPPDDGRTLTLRCANLPGQGLLLALVGKIHAPSLEQAHQQASAYCHELSAIFPLDYKIFPATTRLVFLQLSAKEMFNACRTPESIIQILRFETPLRTKNGQIFLNGFWQTAERADEQIWRALGHAAQPVALNISLRPARLDNDERQVLWDMEHVSQSSDSLSPAHPAQPFDKWAETFINRRLPPWKRFYQIQIHLLAPHGVPEALVRAIGSVVTRESPELLSPGFRAHLPSSPDEAKTWLDHLQSLEPLPTNSNASSLSRLTDLADLAEAHAVFRFPYPPEPGLGVKFIDKLE